MKNIQISDEIYQVLIKLGSKKEDFNSVIYNLWVQTNNINYEEFTDEQTEYNNECIAKIERGDFSQTSELNLDKIDEELYVLNENQYEL